MFEIVSSILKYAFTLIIYIFIFNIIRLILLDIRSMGEKSRSSDTFRYSLKLCGVQGVSGFSIEPVYTLYGEATLGRAPENTITIEDDFLSSTHARFIKKRKAYFIMDNNSTNGIKLNGKRLGTRAVRLKNGDHIHLGRCEFLFVIEKGQVDHEKH